MKLDLPPALKAYVKDLVAHGRYADEADVIRDALRRLADNDLDPETGEPRGVLWAELLEAEHGPRSPFGVMDVFENVLANAPAAAE